MKDLALTLSLFCFSVALIILYIEVLINDMNKKSKYTIELAEIIGNYIKSSLIKVDFQEMYDFIKYTHKEKFKKCDQKFILNFILLYLNNFYK